jgi:hypothetical protein
LFGAFDSVLAQPVKVFIQMFAQHDVCGANTTPRATDGGQRAVTNQLFNEEGGQTGVLRGLLDAEAARREHWRRVPVWVGVDGATALVHPAMISQETAQFHTQRSQNICLNSLIDNVIRSCYTLFMVKKLRPVRINERHLEELEKLAKKDGETVSFHIQQAIREYLKRKAAK